MTLLFGAIVPSERWDGLFEVWDAEEQSIKALSITGNEEI